MKAHTVDPADGHGQTNDNNKDDERSTEIIHLENETAKVEIV